MHESVGEQNVTLHLQWVASLTVVALSTVLCLLWFRQISSLQCRKEVCVRARYSARRQPSHNGSSQGELTTTSPTPPATNPDEALQPRTATPCDALIKCAAGLCAWKDEDASVHPTANKVRSAIHDVPREVEFAEALAELRQLWVRDIRPRFEPAILRDPLLSPENIDVPLARCLDAEGGRVQQAARRLEATAAFRREYRCVDFHRRGMARRLLMHASNGGACVYFGDMGLRALDGTPVLVGRSALMEDAKHRKPSDAMLPAQHLRAALFVIERTATALPARVGSKGAYILDVGGYPVAEMAAHHAARTRYWDADGEGDVRQPAAVLPHLPDHASLTGLGVLKEALRICERHYPETLHKVFFYRPGPGFRMLFAIFRMWVPRSTRDRFVLVRPGEEARHFFRPPPHGAGLRPEDTPRELGGCGPSLDGDLFLRRACDWYDATAMEDSG